MKIINLIVAYQEYDNGIGLNNGIPWRSSTDLKYFKKITTSVNNPQLHNAIIMGRKTFYSIGKELPNRKNYIITRNTDLCDNKMYFSNVYAAINDANNNSNIEKIFIIGGESIYNEMLQNYVYLIDNIYITLINTNFNCDKFFHFDMEKLFTLESNIPINNDECKCFKIYSKTCNLEEYNYLNLIDKILKVGQKRSDRTGVGTISIFGEKLEFDISERIPVLTTKKIPWKMIIKELLWFLSGKTDNKILQDQNVHIWDDNTSREFLDSRGLFHLNVGDIGAGYGHQWRHFGAEYIDCKTDYGDKGIDQINEIIRLIKEEPTSRRIILTGWNPSALHKMALPPCHGIVIQFYVRNEFLDCQMYQRSADVGLGLPFNITSYSILTFIIAQITNLKPGKFIHIIGDAHIYENHVEALKIQLERTPLVFPKLILNKAINCIDNFKLDDFHLIDYFCYPTIKMSMAI